MSAVAVVVASVEVPVAKMSPVKRSRAVIAPDDEALARLVLPVTVRKVAVVDASVEVPVTISVERDEVAVAKSPEVKRLSAVKPADEDADASID